MRGGVETGLDGGEGVAEGGEGCYLPVGAQDVGEEDGGVCGGRHWVLEVVVGGGWCLRLVVGLVGFGVGEEGDELGLG